MDKLHRCRSAACGFYSLFLLFIEAYVVVHSTRTQVVLSETPSTSQVDGSTENFAVTSTKSDNIPLKLVKSAFFNSGLRGIPKIEEKTSVDQSKRDVQGLNLNKLSVSTHQSNANLSSPSAKEASELMGLLERLTDVDLDELERMNLNQLKELKIFRIGLDDVTLEQLENLKRGEETENGLKASISGVGEAKASFHSIADMINAFISFKLNDLKIQMLKNIKFDRMLRKFDEIHDRLEGLLKKVEAGSFKKVKDVTFDRYNMKLDDFSINSENGGNNLTIIPTKKYFELLELQDRFDNSAGTDFSTEGYGNFDGQIGYSTDGQLRNGESFESSKEFGSNTDAIQKPKAQIVGDNTDFILDVDGKQLYVADGGVLDIVSRGKRFNRSTLESLSPLEIKELKNAIIDVEKEIMVQENEAQQRLQQNRKPWYYQSMGQKIEIPQ